MPYTSDVNAGQFNFFICQLKVIGSGLVATIPFINRHSRKVINVIHIYKQCFAIFQSSIRTMHCSFNGFISGYKKVKLITNMATIINDDPSLHFDIEADFYIFTPAVGCTLFGK